MDYASKNHSKYLLMVHLIFVCKYRKKLLIKFGNQIKKILNDIVEEKDFEIIEMIVRLLKQISTYRIWRQNNNHNYLTKQFWLEKTFWSDGYFACSIGNVSKETIEKYIQSQG